MICLPNCEYRRRYHRPSSSFPFSSHVYLSIPLYLAHYQLDTPPVHNIVNMVEVVEGQNYLQGTHRHTVRPLHNIYHVSESSH
jgi:hypothetical protein